MPAAPTSTPFWRGPPGRTTSPSSRCGAALPEAPLSLGPGAPPSRMGERGWATLSVQVVDAALVVGLRRRRPVVAGRHRGVHRGAGDARVAEAQRMPDLVHHHPLDAELLAGAG